MKLNFSSLLRVNRDRRGLEYLINNHNFGEMDLFYKSDKNIEVNNL